MSYSDEIDRIQRERNQKLKAAFEEAQKRDDDIADELAKKQRDVIAKINADYDRQMLDAWNKRITGTGQILVNGQWISKVVHQ